MIFQTIAYLKFLVKSTNQHGVHSPFVYNLITTCFYDTTKHKDYSKLLNYRTGLHKNHKQIEINDFGAGSRIFKSNTRTISAIAKTSGSTIKRTQLLYRLVRYFKPLQILELGTSLGLATQAMALGYPKSKITTIEGCPSISNIANKYFKTYGLDNINQINNTFETAITQLDTTHFDFVFFDGNHNKSATLRYFQLLIDKAHNDSVFIFDDIHWSKDMQEAWKTIITHPKVSVSIDTFFWGFIFFRKEQAKENFNIRL